MEINKLTKEYLINFFKDFKIISDNHFGHQKAFLEFEKIRQKLSNDFFIFEELMMVKINKSKTNSLLYLGDFCINKKDLNKTFKNIKEQTSRIKINNKILIKGNHDKENNEFYIKSGWDYVINKPVIFLNDEIIELKNNFEYTGCIITKINGKNVLFSHFGIFDNDPRYNNKFEKQIIYLQNLYEKYNCELNIHGHSHSSKTYTKKSFNVSVENINFKPISFDEIIKKIENL